MKFKKFFGLLLVLVLTVVLAGCQRFEKLTVLSADNLKAEINKQKSKVQIKFRVSFGKDIYDVVEKELVAPFNEQLAKEGYNAEVKLEQESGYDSLLKKNREDARSRKYAPHVSLAYPDHIAKYLISGVIQELSSFVNDSKIGIKNEIADFNQEYLKETRYFDEKETIYGLPFNKSTEVMYYRRDFMEQFPIDYKNALGTELFEDGDLPKAKDFLVEVRDSEGKLTAKHIKVPRTWEEIEDFSNFIVKALKKYYDCLKADPKKALPEYFGGQEKFDAAFGDFVDFNGKQTFKNFRTVMYDSLGNFFTTAMHQSDAPYTGAIINNGKVDVQRGLHKYVDNVDSQKAILYFKNLFDKAVLGVPQQWEEKYASTLLSNCRTLLNVGSSGGTNYYTNGEYGVVPAPYRTDKNKRTVIQQGTNLVMFNTGTNLQRNLAWKFIKTILTPENCAKFSMGTGYLPVRKSVYEIPAYKEFLAKPSLKTEVVRVMKDFYESPDQNVKYTFFVDPAWGTSSEVRTNSETYLKAILMDLQIFDKPENEQLAKINEQFKKIHEKSTK